MTFNGVHNPDIWFFFGNMLISWKANIGDMGKVIDRREFLGKLAGAGALVAVSGLPAVAVENDGTGNMVPAGEKEKLFARRGRFERLALSYAVVKIGLEHPFSVMHISDTHLSEAYPGEGETKKILKDKRSISFGGFQEQALRDSLDWARRNVDYIVMTGDLIDWQSEANFDLVRKYFGEGMTGSVGNHEFSPDMWLSAIKEERTEAFKDNTRSLIQSVYPFDLQFCSQVVNGVNFITLDNVYGYVVQKQVDLFKAEAARGLPIVLCMHVPFFTDDIWTATCRFWGHQNEKFTDGSVPPPAGDYLIQKEDAVTREFITYLKDEPLLKAILAGHEHITMQDRFSPTAVEYLVGGNFLLQAREILFV